MLPLTAQPVSVSTTSAVMAAMRLEVCISHMASFSGEMPRKQLISGSWIGLGQKASGVIGW